MLEYPLFSVSWILGRFCNYKCSYCWPYANSSTPDYQSLEVYKNTINQIKIQARQNKSKIFFLQAIDSKKLSPKRERL